MKIVAELILSDDSVATVRQILAADWLLIFNLKEPESSLAMILTLTKVNGKPLTEEILKNFPLEDYLVINHTIQKEFKRIMEYVPVFDRELK